MDDAMQDRMDEVEAALAALAALPDVMRARRPAQQVLVYEGHLPLRLFLVLDGAVAVEAPARSAPLVRSTREGGPFFVPDPRELDRPAGARVVLAVESDLLCIPRSLVTERGGAEAALPLANIATLSLQGAGWPEQT